MSEKPKVWLTGAAGQVGTALRTLFPEPDSFVWVPTTRDDVDLSDLEEVAAFIKTQDFDAMVNCAAFTDVNGAESNPRDAEILNSDLPALIFGLISTGIHISTNYVFPSRPGQPYEESEWPAPNVDLGVYALTKLFGERKAFALGATVIRTAWVYSPNSWGKTSFYSKIRRQLDEGKTLRVVTDEIGNPTSALTLARGIYTLLSDHFSGKELLRKEVLHFTDMSPVSRYDLAVGIARLLGSDADISKAKMSDFPSPVRRPEEAVLAPGRLSDRIKVPRWQDSLKEVIEIDNKD